MDKLNKPHTFEIVIFARTTQTRIDWKEQILTRSTI